MEFHAFDHQLPVFYLPDIFYKSDISCEEANAVCEFGSGEADTA